MSSYSQSIPVFSAVIFLNSVKQWIQYTTGTKKNVNQLVVKAAVGLPEGNKISVVLQD